MNQILRFRYSCRLLLVPNYGFVRQLLNLTIFVGNQVPLLAPTLNSDVRSVNGWQQCQLWLWPPCDGLQRTGLTGKWGITCWIRLLLSASSPTLASMRMSWRGISYVKSRHFKIVGCREACLSIQKQVCLPPPSCSGWPCGQGSLPVTT